MKKGVPDWKYNSAHMEEIAGWIVCIYPLCKRILYPSRKKAEIPRGQKVNQMRDSIDVLKATIISIFFSHMGVEKELIRRIMAFENELKWQTMCLRNEADRTFKHPHEVMEVEQKSEEEEMKPEKEKRTILGRLKDKISHLKKKD